jgi:hypothetical protein
MRAAVARAFIREGSDVELAGDRQPVAASSASHGALHTGSGNDTSRDFENVDIVAPQ